MSAPARKVASTIQTRRLSYALGGEIVDFKLDADMSDETVAELRQALLDHLVIVFRGQDLSPADQVMVSRRFGDCMVTPGLDRWVDPEYPELFIVTNKRNPDGTPSETRHTARKWHSDQSFMAVPSLGSLLYCVEKPKIGGDTMFANMYMAYDALSDTMKKTLEGLRAIHDYFYYSAFKDGTRAPFTADELAKVPPVSHPVVRTHPETGRKLIYVNESLTSRFDGMTEEESRPLLEFLFRHLSQPAFTYRHNWQVGDLVFWDNRATQHMAPPDYDIEHMDAAENHRYMRRTTIAGTKPY
ncbi:MAG: TauD/TfdA family dioxygenase [Alphaproteobacteria bacterium]|nr:TauD/TfdA family dioxygenase [Alphaproteobacteria bacterium]